MNPYSLIVLSALLIQWLLDRLAGRWSLARLGPTPPAEVAAAYPPETWARTREYVGARTRFAHLFGTFDLVLLLAFWGLGGFAWLEAEIAAWGLAPLWHGLAYIGVLLTLHSLAQLPAEWWSTFRIEQRFGFNRTDAATFWGDRLKGLVLGVLLGGPLLAALLAFFQSYGPAGWLPGWIAWTGLTLALQWIVPLFILPLFFKLQPLEEGGLRARLLDYAGKVQFPLQDVYVIDGSRRSSKANAFFTGMGKARRVALFDNLVEKHSEDEVVAVLAHEIGHYKRRHVVQSTVIGIAHSGILLFLLGRFLGNTELHAAFGLEQAAVHTGLVLFGLLYTPIELLLSVVMNALSRRNEFEADAFARETLGDGSHLADALVQLSTDSLSNPAPHPLSVWLHASHPPVPARIKALLVS